MGSLIKSSTAQAYCQNLAACSPTHDYPAANNAYVEYVSHLFFQNNLQAIACRSASLSS